MSRESLLNQLTNDAYSAWSGEVVPWSAESLNVYYLLRNDTPAIVKATAERRKCHAQGQVVTWVDDVQLEREPNFAQKHQAVQAIFDALKREMSEQDFDAACLKLLSIYLEQLKLPPEKYEGDKREICTRVEIINRYLAFKFIKVIENESIDKSQVKRLFKGLGALQSEVLAWISVGLRRRLFDEDLSEAKVNRITESAVVFYETALDIPSHAIPSIKVMLQHERLVWHGMYHEHDPAQRLKCWQSYLYLKGSVHTPLLVTRINEHLKRYQAIKKSWVKGLSDLSPASYDRMLTRALLIRCVSRAPHLLLPGEELVSFYEGELHLPIEASEFYEMLDADETSTRALLCAHASHAPDTLQTIMWHIFSDEAYTERHKQLLAARVHEDLTEERYPLFVLRDHKRLSLEGGQLQRYWTQLLESGLLTETNFFANAENRTLFRAVVLNFDLSNIALIKRFCHALTLYRGFSVDVECARHPDNPELVFDEASHWAEELLETLLTKVAYPNGAKNMDFGAVVRFLGIEFNQPARYGRPDKFHEELLRDCISYEASHPETRVSHQDKLLHAFISIFMKREKLTPEQAKDISHAASRQELPTRLVRVGKIMRSRAQVDIPEWLPLWQQLSIMSVLNLPEMSDSEQQASYSERLYFIRELYRAYCEQQEKPTLDETSFLTLQSRLDALTGNQHIKAIKMRTKNTLDLLETYHRTAVSYQHSRWSWLGRLLGYHVEETTSEFSCVQILSVVLENQDLRTRKGCKALKDAIKQLDSASFKRSFWRRSPCHEMLLELDRMLDALMDDISAVEQKATTPLHIDAEERELSEGVTHNMRPVNDGVFSYATSCIQTMFGSCMKPAREYAEEAMTEGQEHSCFTFRRWC